MTDRIEVAQINLMRQRVKEAEKELEGILGMITAAKEFGIFDNVDHSTMIGLIAKINDELGTD